MLLTEKATKIYLPFPAPGQGSPSLEMTWAEETVQFLLSRNRNALHGEGVVLTA